MGEVSGQVVKELKLPAPIVRRLHGIGIRTEQESRLAWARTKPQ